VRLLETYDAAETDGFPVKLPALPFNVGTSLPSTSAPARHPYPTLALTPAPHLYLLPTAIPFPAPTPGPIPDLCPRPSQSGPLQYKRTVIATYLDDEVRPCCTLCTLCTLRTLRTLRTLIADSLRRCWCCATRPAVLMC
jgi:hypothetical protein